MKHLKTERFDISYFQDYVATYHERYPDKQNIMFLDMLYGLGICVDSKKYKNADGFEKFIKWISDSYLLDEDEKFMKMMYEDEKKRIQEEIEHNNKILTEIEKDLGKEYVTSIRECLKESETHGKIEIVEKSDIDKTIDKQMEDWGEFDYVYVDQYCNGGHTGDDFAGFIYIPIKNGKYLKSHYSM